MFDLINGLPWHPLVVHVVVVLLPLAVLGTVAIALVPRWRRPYGPLVIVAAAVSTALTPVATSSGEALEKRVGDPGEHAELGDQLIWFSVALLVAVVALVVLDRRGAPAVSRALVNGVAAVAVVVALASAVQVYRVGDSGARAAWGDRVDSARR